MSRLSFRRQSDEQLLDRACRGDETSFGELHRRYRPVLFGYSLIRLRDRQAAEDATQEVFLRATRAWNPETAIDNVKAWLFTVAHNVVIDAARKQQSAPRHLDLASEAVSNSVELAEEQRPGSDATGATFLALRRLPSRQRKALVLREFHDMPSARIAQELKTSAGNVDVLVSRGRAAFGKAYAEVAELPPACLRATELIYRQMGSGVSERHATAMRAHLETCPRCRAEYRRAHAAQALSGLLLFLHPGALPFAAKTTVGLAIVAAIATPIALDTPGPRPAIVPFESSLAPLTRPSSMAAIPTDAVGNAAIAGIGGAPRAGDDRAMQAGDTLFEASRLEAMPRSSAEEGHDRPHAQDQTDTTVYSTDSYHTPSTLDGGVATTYEPSHDTIVDRAHQTEEPQPRH